MNLTDDDILKFQAGVPIFLDDICAIFPATLREIVEEGYSNFQKYLSVLTTTKPTSKGEDKELDELVEDYTLYHTNKDRFMLFEDSHLVKGKLSTNRKGYGFVEGGDLTSKEDDIYISADNMNGAIDGDLVICEITSKKNIDRKWYLKIIYG